MSIESDIQNNLSCSVFVPLYKCYCTEYKKMHWAYDISSTKGYDSDRQIVYLIKA